MRKFRVNVGGVNGLWWGLALTFCAVALVMPPQVSGAGGSLKVFAVRNSNIGGDFSLIDQHGKRVGLTQYRGKVVLIAFGFTHCPDVCPTTMVKMGTVLKKLGKDADSARMMFISVDPERDTPEILGKYAGYFHKDIIALTGSVDEVQDMAYQYTAPFRKIETGTATKYVMAHSSFFFMVGTAGKLKYMLPHATTAPQLVEGIRGLLH